MYLTVEGLYARTRGSTDGGVVILTGMVGVAIIATRILVVGPITWDDIPNWDKEQWQRQTALLKDVKAGNQIWRFTWRATIVILIAGAILLSVTD